MFASVNLGRWFGIPVTIHWTFWLLPLWVVLAQPGGLPVGFVLAALFAMFGCIVLHEFGHALTARWFGIPTRDVTLYPIGGVARLERMSERAWEEFAIAIAGPLVNVVIAVFLGFLLAAGLLAMPGADNVAANFLYTLIVLNIGMAVFNLAPAFPLDGGRIFRAALAGFMPRLRATRIAVAVGSALAVLAGITALLQGWPMLLVISVFVFFAGQQELRYLEYREFMQRQEKAYEPPLPAADLPPWLKPRVTVYVYDAQTGQWLPDSSNLVGRT